MKRPKKMPVKGYAKEGVITKVSIPSVTTPRLRLRAFRQEDEKPLYRILNQKNILQYFPNPDPPSLDKVRKIITDQLKHWEKHGYGWWAVVPRIESRLIGWCGLQYLSKTNEVEVAYLLSKAWWGKGLATEGAKASLQFGFNELGLTSIVGIVHPDNRASQRVLEKAGLMFAEQAQYFGMDCYRYIKNCSL